MAKQKNNIVIPLDEKSEAVLLDIVKKHNLEETDEEAFEKVKKEMPFNDGLIIQLVRELMVDKISNKEFLDTLHKELKLPKQKVKELAIDIMSNLVTLLEKIPEDQLQEYNRKKQREASAVQQESEPQEIPIAPNEKEKFRQELLDKIKANAPTLEPDPEETPPAPGQKKPGITDVEKNAATIQHAQKQEEDIPKQEVIEEKKPVDPYKEPVE